ncbi:PREDICTED: uncharacterized protein LOC104720377 [Camelina sativa]|uniref:Uncharacterized protein LOC104720377 n=1 Tax=Camelina sativa TaxID=90675 RepID=A0ABM0U6E6_CAMSA|nr:PREDICTED: uncharacterized protein LOC104720377 [Camelina sativa]
MSSFPSDVIDSSNTNTLHTVNMSNVTKLTASNFLMWNREIRALLAGYGLAGYLDGTTPAPASTVTTNGASTVNPDYTLWFSLFCLKHPPLLRSGVFSPLPMLAQVGVTLSISVNKSATGRRAPDQLMNTFKGLFLGLISLHFLGIDYVLAGLPEDYKPVVYQIDGRDTPPSIATLHEKLINYELKLLFQVLSRR